MNSKLITSLCVFIIGHFAYGQDGSQLPMPKRFISSVAVSAGINLSRPYGNDFLSKNGVGKTGYIFGLSASHDFSRILSLDLSVFYERKNSSNIYDILDQSLVPPQNANTIEELAINYLTIAPALSFRLGQPSRFFVGVGGYYSFLRGVEFSQVVSYAGIVKYYSYSRSAIYNKDFDTGLVFSLKYRQPLSERYDIHLQLLNSLGLTDITSDKLKALPIKNNSYSILIGLTLKK